MKSSCTFLVALVLALPSLAGAAESFQPQAPAGNDESCRTENGGNDCYPEGRTCGRT